MPVKTYVLNEALDSNAPIYQTLPEGKRSQIKKVPFWRPYLLITFQDKNGVSKTLRYKAGASDAEGRSVLEQREQIDKLKMDANLPFTTAERADLMFRHGKIVTNKKIVQDYLEAYPACEGFEGFCDEVRQPVYKILDNELESKIKNTDTRKRIKAANKVLELDLEGKQALLIRLNGSFFETPNDPLECENMLMEFIDDAEEAGLNAVLKEDKNIDEETAILLGKLINAKVLSFDVIEGNISKLSKEGKWVVIREMSNQYSAEERLRLFSDFLNTADGKALKNDLIADLELVNKKNTKK